MADAVVSLAFSNGDSISFWESLSLKDRWDDPIGAFDLTCRPPRHDIARYSEMLRKGKLAGLLIDDKPLASVLIQRVRRTVGREGVTFDISCQSPLATAHEASANPEVSKSFQSDSPVSSVVLEVMRPFGFTEVHSDTTSDVVARTGKPIGNRQAHVDVKSLKERDMQVQDGESAYGFCARIIARLGLLLKSDHGGRLIVGKPDFDQEPIYTLVSELDIKTAGDRLLDGIEIEDTNEGQFSEIVVRGQALDTSGQTAANKPLARVAVPGLFVPSGVPFERVKSTELEPGPHRYSSDDDTAPFKPKYVTDKECRDKKFCEAMARTLHGVKSSNAFVITCEVAGLVSATGRPWATDTVARVIIESLEIDDVFWIHEVSMSLDRSRGQRTRLRLIPLGSLVLGNVS